MRVYESEDDGTRTRNHRIDSPPISRSNSKQDKQFAPPLEACCTTGRTRDTSEGGIVDPELAALLSAWPKLPEHIRAAIRALLSTVADDRR